MRSSSENRGFSLYFLFYILIFILMPVSLLAQQGIVIGNPILFRGVVNDAVTQKPIEGVQYYSDRLGATNVEGLFSFYAHSHDTVIFECSGYRKTVFIVSDTLRASEYTMGIYMNPDTLFISEVVIIPRLEDLRTSVMSKPTLRSAEEVNAANNLKLSAYQSLAGIDELGDPDANYQAIKQQQKINAYEKGGIPSDRMASLSPLILIPALKLLMNGLPEAPSPPAPYLSSKELQEIREIRKKASGNNR